MAIKPVSITDAEEMQSELLQHVWNEDILVLVLLVWVSWLVAYTCCEGEFGNAVEPLCCHFGLGNWSGQLCRSFAVSSSVKSFLVNITSCVSSPTILSRKKFPLKLNLFWIFGHSLL